jgi:ribosomal protein S18 acetylase RimI-like enzyme
LDRAAYEAGPRRDPVDLSRIDVGETRGSEIEAAIAVAARALADGPLTIAVIGDDLDLNFRYLRRFFRLQYKLAAHQRPLVARLDGRVIASTNDLHDGACHASPWAKIRSLPALLAIRPAVAGRTMRWFSDWERRDPGHRPHSHLGPFGVEPELQGNGIGSAVLTEYCRRLDAAGEDSYLETEKPENVALYSRFGFEVIEEAEVLGVPNWFMWRDAGAQGPGMR